MKAGRLTMSNDNLVFNTEVLNSSGVTKNLNHLHELLLVQNKNPVSQDHQIKTNERLFDQFNSFLIRKVNSLIRQTGLRVCDRFIVNVETKESHAQTCETELEELRKKEMKDLRDYAEDLNKMNNDLM